MVRKNIEDLRNLVKSVRDRSFPYEKREEVDRNWHQYDQAQVNEIADVLETIRDVVNIASSLCVRESVRFSLILILLLFRPLHELVYRIMFCLFRKLEKDHRPIHYVE